jgi:hypothetical protein
VFTHAVPAEALGPVEVILWPRGIVEEQQNLGVVAPGESLRVELQESVEDIDRGFTRSHTLVLPGALTQEGSRLWTTFQIVQGGITTVTVQLDAEGEPELVVSVEPPAPETASPRPQTVTVPTRVETGAGGSAADGARKLVLGGVATAAAVGLLVGNLRRPDAAGRVILPGRPANGGPDRGQRPRNRRN